MIRAYFQHGMELVSYVVMMNTATEKYWVIYEAATVI